MKTEFFFIAAKNLRKRKLRSFLTLVGIMISIATIFVLISVSIGLQNAVQEQFQKLGTDKFFIQPRGQFGPPGSSTVGAILTKDDVEEIEKVLGVKEATYWTIGNAKIEFNDEIRFVQVGGADIEHADLLFATYDIEDGRILDKQDSGNVVVGSQYKHNNFFSRPVAIRDTILINDREFRVIGILETVGNPSDDRLIYMPEDEFRALFNISERIDFIIVQVDEDINAAADRVERTLIKSRDLDKDNIDFTILTPEELLASFGVVLNIITYFLFGVAAISLLVGGINIANTMFTSVLERTKEIGVMKAIGEKNSDILTIFLIEAGILGFIGGIAGILLGFALSQTIEYIAVNQLATSLLQTSSPPELIIGCLAFAFFAGAVSGIWPAWKATKIKPVEALRYE